MQSGQPQYTTANYYGKDTPNGHNGDKDSFFSGNITVKTFVCKHLFYLSKLQKPEFR